MRQNSKGSLIEAMIGLAAEQGLGGCTTQQIAQRAGVSEGAIYRHYRSKDELRWAAYRQVVADMIEEKKGLAASSLALPELLHEWIRLTYQFFDQNPKAFTFVLLIPPPKPLSHSDRKIVRQQGQILMARLRQARMAGEMKPLSPRVALCFFTGLMLNVPRQINEGTLRGPAERYTDTVSQAVWKILRPNGHHK